MKLMDFVIQDAIVPALEGTQRDEVVRELVDKLVEAGAVDAAIREELIERVLEREKKASTGFGRGVAVPHVKHDGAEQVVAAIGVSPTGVEFAALDRKPVHCVFFLLSPQEQPDEHLQAMENIFSNLQNERFRRFLRQATTREEIVELLRDADDKKLE